MSAMSRKFASVDEYHASFPKPVRDQLNALRALILQAAPDAKGEISYNMPAFRQVKTLVYYAAHTSHVGFYPMASALREFKDELGAYATSKGTIQFPFGKRIPAALVKRIVAFRVREVAAKLNTTKKRKPS